MKRFILLLLIGTSYLSVFGDTNVRVARYFGNKKAAVSYTFDDGLLEHFTLVFPELQKRGIRATFGIIGSKVGHDMKGTPCMTWSQLREMAEAGQEIASHGWMHQNVEKLSREALRYEVEHNDSVIADSTGIRPLTYFYPGNRKTPEAVEFCSRNRVGTRTFQTSIGSKRDEMWLRRWIDGLLATGDWGVGMTHGITVGYDAFVCQQTLWSHLDYACTMADSLWIAPLCDVTAYVTERDSLKLDVRKGRSSITVIPYTGLDGNIFTHPLTLVVSGDRVVSAVQDGKSLSVYTNGGETMIDFSPCGGQVMIKLAQ